MAFQFVYSLIPTKPLIFGCTQRLKRYRPGDESFEPCLAVQCGTMNKPSPFLLFPPLIPDLLNFIFFFNLR